MVEDRLLEGAPEASRKVQNISTSRWSASASAEGRNPQAPQRFSATKAARNAGAKPAERGFELRLGRHVEQGILRGA